MSPPSLAHRVLLLAALLTAACSSGSGPSASGTPLAGAAFDAYLPMHDGDVYEFDTGWRLNITAAQDPRLGSGPVMRVEFDSGIVQSGFYWSHGDQRGSLHHGGFDTGAGRMEVFTPPIPVIPGQAGPLTADYQLFALGSGAALGQGSARYRADLGRVPGYSPNLLYVPTPFGTWRWNEMRVTRWHIDLDDGDRQRRVEVQMYCGPGFGPLQLVIDGQPHITLRAVVKGVTHNGWHPGGNRSMQTPRR